MISQVHLVRFLCNRMLILLAVLLLGHPSVLFAQFPLPDSFNPGAQISTVYSLAVQPDGKILAGGIFTTLGGQARNNIGRLNPDGTLDTGFNPDISRAVSCLTLQADGKILVGGTFTNIGGQPRNYIGRLVPDGTLDTGFNPGVGGTVSSLVVQADGKILVVSSYTNLDGQMRNSIGRLNPDGTMDNGFNPEVIGIGSPAPINSLAMQMDGKILVGGSFTNINGQTRNHIGRLNPDGTLDTDFNPKFNSYVSSLAVQADGKILLGGYYTAFAGQMPGYITRLNPDGTLDNGFFRSGLNYRNYPSYVYSLAVQTDGKILVGGRIPPNSSRMLNHIVRLNPNGTRDTNFTSGVSYFSYYYSSVESLAVQSDGKILVGGYFTNLCGQVRNNIGRLNATDPATQSLNYDGSTITWLRGGTSPEVWRTVCEWSQDGLLWTSLGEGARVPGGWQWTKAAFSTNVTIRTRGFVTGGGFGSGWFVETMGMYRPGSDTGSPGRMVVVYDNPLLEAARETDGQPSLLLYARPGWTCAIEERPTLAPDAPWREVQSVTVTNMATPLPLTCTNTQGFFRAVR